MKKILLFIVSAALLAACNPNGAVIGFPASPETNTPEPVVPEPEVPDPEPETPPTPATELIDDYFTMPSATLQSGSFPTSTAAIPLSNFTANDVVLNGGSLYVSYTTDIGPHTILVGVEGVDGYYEIVPEQGEGNEWHFVLVVSSGLDVTNFVIIIAIRTSSGDVGTITESDVELKAAGSGLLQISLSFDNEKDVDLHVVEPSGDHIFYGARRSANGGYLDIDSNAGCSIDGINNENVYYEEGATVEAGTYKVYALMYSNCDPTVATNCVITVFYKGEILAVSNGQTNPTGKTFPVNAPNEGSAFQSVDPVLTFEIPADMAIQGTGTYEPVAPSPSAIRKMNNY